MIVWPMNNKFKAYREIGRYLIKEKPSIYIEDWEEPR
jgi:hypothetical protein